MKMFQVTNQSVWWLAGAPSIIAMKPVPRFPRTRRQWLAAAVRAGLLAPLPWWLPLRPGLAADHPGDQGIEPGIEVNDVQSQLNPTLVRAIATPLDSGELPALVHRARRDDQVISLAGGRHFLTYHRWAGRRQLAAVYPQLAEFLKLKRHHDPDQRFQSDWYRHHRDLLLP